MPELLAHSLDVTTVGKVPGWSELFSENASELWVSARPIVVLARAKLARERNVTPQHGTHLRFPSPGPLRHGTKWGSEPDVLGRPTAPADETACGPAGRIHPESFDSSGYVARERPGSCNASRGRSAVSCG